MKVIASKRVSDSCSIDQQAHPRTKSVPADQNGPVGGSDDGLSLAAWLSSNFATPM